MGGEYGAFRFSTLPPPHFTHHYTTLPFLPYTTMNSLSGAAAGITQVANPAPPSLIRSLSTPNSSLLPSDTRVFSHVTASGNPFLSPYVARSPPSPALAFYPASRTAPGLAQQQVEILNYGEVQELIRQLPINLHAVYKAGSQAPPLLHLSISSDATLATAAQLDQHLSWFNTQPPVPVPLWHLLKF